MINFNCDLVNLWKECEPRRRYICNLEQNFQELQDERARLIAKKNARNREISNAEDRGMAPTDTLTGWIGRVQRMEQDLESILGPEEDPHQLPEKCLGGCCYTPADFKSACELGSAVAENLLRVKALREEQLEEAEMFTRASVDYLPVNETLGMDTKFAEIWDSVAKESEEHPQIIRICGMGGVGKTTLLKRVHNTLRTQKLGFNLVIWVDAACSSDVQSIQLAICEKLELPWRETATERTHATNISVALKKRKFVLFIDDPQKDLTLTNVGFPIQDNKINKYKIVFATRDEAVSLGMGGDQYHTIQLARLEMEYAQMLFKKTVGKKALNSDPAIPDLATSVAELCDGLPLTLITVGQAMSSKRTHRDWEYAIKMLRDSAHKFEGMEEVYEKFLVSYYRLSKTAKRCFLYCSLFSKDAGLETEQLIDYWIGEGFLNEFRALNDIRNPGHSIISTLKAAYLLESGEQDMVRMHDTIRGSALWIAAEYGEQENKFWVRSRAPLEELPADYDMNWAAVERISLVRCEVKRLNKFNCSNLSTLILKRSKFGEISPGFFQSMGSLKVLDLSWCYLDKLPADITTLTALQYLNLSHTYISELPGNFKKLNKLKILDLSFIDGLRKIPSKVIRSLSKLQVLNMYCSGFKNQINKGSVLFGSGEDFLNELKPLHHLQDLRITVTSAIALHKLWNSTKLYCTHSLFITKCEGSVALQLPPVENMVNLTVFHVSNCPDLVKVLDEKEEAMEAEDQRHGSEIRLGGQFRNLRHVEIESCWVLKNLTWLKCAPTLQSLKVVKCAIMEEAIGDNGSSSGAGNEQNQLFSNLRSIHLSNLPELKSISNKALPFPCLEEITVLYCPKMVNLPLDAQSAKRKLKLIRGHEKWWDKLQWDDEALKSSFSTYFKSE